MNDERRPRFTRITRIEEQAHDGTPKTAAPARGGRPPGVSLCLPCVVARRKAFVTAPVEGAQDRVYKRNMKSRWHEVREQLNLEGIPAIRRHVYFYLLLALTTILAHGLWKEFKDSSTDSNAAGQSENLDHVPNLAGVCEPLYEWLP